MIDLFEYTKNKLIKNDEIRNNKGLFYSEIREIMQGVILPCLTETKFFDNNAFLGGTAIRMLYGLKRYSDDLDFTMKENKIADFSWKTYIDHLVEYGKGLDITFDCKEDKDKFGNKIIRIKSDSILEMLDGKNIVPDEFTNKNNRKKISIKLETNFAVNTFTDEMKSIGDDNKYKVRVFDLPSLFAGKINAILTREETNQKTGGKERVDHGRDWYDLVWYIDKRAKPNYNFLSDKLDYKGSFEGKHIKANLEWVKNELFNRMEGLDYNMLNLDIASITLKDYRIILNKELLTEKINILG